MQKPDSRRVGRPATRSTPVRPPTSRGSRPVPKTARKGEEEVDERKATAAAASQESKAKNQMALIGGIGGGGLLLLILIVAAASSGSSGRASEEAQRKSRKAAPPPVVEAPPPKPKPTNYVRNTGAIVFVCAGTERHPDKEVVLPGCPKCPAKNQFEVDGEARAYRCTKCKGVYENADIKCADCGRPARVTHLKKAALGQ